MSSSRVLRILFVLGLSAALQPLSADDRDVSRSGLTFERDVRPIFRAHCFDCHGAEAEKKGNLDLRLVRLQLVGGDSGPAIEPGHPESSVLLERIRSGEMPPGSSKVSAAELKVLEQWVAEGARTARPEPEQIGDGLGLTPEERSFWSFLPIARPAVPPLADFDPSRRVRTEIDALLLQSGSSAARFAPDADRETLIRRAFLDLVGLPPSPEEFETWAQDSADDWYDRLLTELLSSPHYGERWGRHWLDIAGYADSEGFTNDDRERPWAWKYRDWVIQALNDDLPFDQFVTQQLAGDELAGPRNGDLTPEQTRLLAATGFLRMAADGTGSGADTPEGRNQVMADTLKIVGTSLLGVSLQCAQCHDHRYDPIPQTDYYAIRAVFEPALDWKAWQNPEMRRVSLYTIADRAQADELEAQTKGVADERAARLAAYMQQALDTELQKYAEPLRTQLRTAYETAAGERTAEQQQQLAANPSVNINPGNLYQYIPESKTELEKLDASIAAIRARKPVEQFLRALVEPPQHLPTTFLFHRGDFQQPRQEIAPGGLTVATPEDASPEFPTDAPNLPTSGRRLAFARWLTNEHNPLFARVIVNRIWLHHFGRGLVETPADFGRLGVRPEHPQLLDWLADEFRRSGWSLRHMHRLIMTSTAWRQSTRQELNDNDTAAAPSAYRRHMIRLDAETIRDRMLAASGELDRTLYGPPLGISQDDTGQVIVDGTQKRRSVYIQVRRSRPVAMMQTFDAPVMQTNCELRPTSTVATQSLMLMNGEFILAQSARLAARATTESTPVASAHVSDLALPTPAVTSAWSYGYGRWQQDADPPITFSPLTRWHESRWQAGPEFPDPVVGWAMLNAQGGHPGDPERAVIRRWTARATGTVSIAGTLSHGSENGDGVQGRIISSRHGMVGSWHVKNNSGQTAPAAVPVEAGDTIDFVTESGETVTSDSFSWPVTVTLQSDAGDVVSSDSVRAFRGPTDPPEVIVGRVRRAWQLALVRFPDRDETQLALEFLGRQTDVYEQAATPLPELRTPDQQALIDLCQSLLSSNEFLYVE